MRDAELGPVLAEGREAQVFRLDARTAFRVSVGSAPAADPAGPASGRRSDGRVDDRSDVRADVRADPRADSRADPPAGSDERALQAQAQAWNGGAPVPRPYGRATVEGRPGLVMELLDPHHLLAHLGAAPWTVTEAGRIMGAVHASVHRVPAPPSLPAVGDLALARIAAAGLPVRHRHELAELVRSLPRGDRLLHGDLNPANLLRRTRTGEWLAVDWAEAARGSPAADVALTLVMIGSGAVPANTPAWARTFAPIGRLLLARAYLDAYRTHAHHALDTADVRPWTLVWRHLRVPARPQALPGSPSLPGSEVPCTHGIRLTTPATASPSLPPPVRTRPLHGPQVRP